METELAKLYFNIGKYKYPILVEADKKYYYFQFAYNPPLMAEVKAMSGAKYLGFDKSNPRKVWRVNRNKRNEFQLAYLMGRNPYKLYDTIPETLPQSRFPLLGHQAPGAALVAHTRGCILAHEMGLGKTLTVFAAIDHLRPESVMWVAPKSALNSVRLEYEKWQMPQHHPTLNFQLHNYEKITSWWDKTEGQDGPFVYPPQMLVVDESQRIKTYTAKRSQAIYDLAETVRQHYKDKACVVLLSGSPAPRTPADWWHQCEVACPGFLREGSHKALVSRLAWVQLQEGIGGSFNKISGWKDDEDKCEVCGKPHRDEPFLGDHSFKESFNEVKHLYKRMKGLVDVRFKKDCLDLPPKVYDVRKLVTPVAVLKQAKLIEKVSRRAIEALTKLRELSDGFLYKETETDKQIVCEFCQGSGIPNEKIMPGAKECLGCSGRGYNLALNRVAIRTDTPKDAATEDILDEHSDIGRLVIYAGFEASVDRCVELAHKNGWKYIRADGRGWITSMPNRPGTDGWSQTDMLKEFQKPVDHPYKTDRVDQLVFIGHAGAAGTGLTLTASPSILYYSNDFNAENRIQSEDRIHRIGSSGAKIIDLVNLPTDQLILDNLKKKREMQALTLGDIFTGWLPDDLEPSERN